MKLGFKLHRRMAWPTAVLLAAVLGTLIWWGMATQAVLADGSPLDNSLKTVYPAVVKPGDTVTYSIVLRNTHLVSDVTALLNDPLDSQLSFVTDSESITPPGTGNFSAGAGGITWSNVPVDAGDVVTLTFQAVVDAGAGNGDIITNTATISDGLASDIQKAVGVTVDTEVPHVLIMVPAAGAVVTSTELSMSGYAWDLDADHPPFPDSPVVAEITNGGSGYYRVNWSAVAQANYYLIEEATSSDFSDAGAPFECKPPVNAVYCDIMARTAGIYYYRVRAIGSSGNSRWSNVEAATVTSFAQNVAPKHAFAAPTAIQGDNLEGVWVQIDGSPWYKATGTLQWSHNLLLAQTDYAEHTVKAYARDMAGFTSVTDTISFYADRLAPVPSVTNLTAGQNVGGSSFVILGTTPSDGSGLERVEVSINGGTSWAAATGTASWSYNWTSIVPNHIYTVTARSLDAAGNWSAASTPIVVEANEYRAYFPLLAKRTPPLPYASALVLDSNDTYGNYAVSWSYPHIDNYPPTSYRFQEATDADFTNLTLNEARTSPQAFKEKAVGTYYYRVRGINANGEGPWSDTIAVEVKARGFSDDFSDVNSGWQRKLHYRGELPGVPDGPVLDLNYENGSYRVKIMLNTDGYNNKRMGIIPAPYVPIFTNYSLQVDHRFAVAGDQSEPPTSGKAGLIFAASSNYQTLYVFEWNFEGDCAVNKYVDATLPTTIIDFSHIHGLRNWGACPMNSGYDKINTFKTVVSGNNVTIYINGNNVGTFSDDGFPTHNYVGLVTGSWERTPVESRFDNFAINPN